MALAAVAPETVEITVAGTSPTLNAWLWSRALLTKAQMGLVAGATRVKVMLTNALGTTAAAALAAGAQIGLATRSGWNTGAKVLTNVLGGIAKGALLVGKAISWVADKVGRAVAWFVGLFNKGAGESIRNANANFTAWRTAKIEGGKARIEAIKQVAVAAMTTKGVSTVGRIGAGVMGLGTIANLATHGAVAAQAAALPYIGGVTGLAFGPIGLLVTAGIALVGGLFSFLFRKDQVMERMEEIELEASAKLMGLNEELVVTLTPNGKGGAKMSVSGHPVLVRTIKSDPALAAEVAEAALKAETEAAAPAAAPGKKPAKAGSSA